ncbi:MAG: 30S ribosome-binding factor RbfA [Pelagibacteraceae bacterium]|jgi:ribosome-binding factor A|nr:30S ribosome-binding factor RbfA [Pelagibacteraceae bacterium]MBT3902090.1 30S ribosome-binding factor RbfA [Pelagibacteraceae bacterium]MBT4645328.1 30S ribosome-binding factor RbfA [Pelagibacteraceae bacterium]MBT4950779.1 30S ribosome-binding factor RbfA [Pelagibacteraceae bacterium]MBT5213293.1 30S ribosome-binding factor RbfA [Pelagibacteraceae bacterium]
MSNQMSSQRQMRFSELIRSLISKCLLVEDFYNLSFQTTSITISYVRMSKDLRIANIYVMPLGGENKIKIIKELNEKKYIFQKFLSKARLNSKFTPKVMFFLDDSFDEAEKIEKLLLNKNVSRDLDE